MQSLTYDSVLERCIQLVSSSKHIPPETISSTTSFESLGVDSLDLINLSFEIEEAFDVQIPDESISSIHTLDDMARGVVALLSSKPAVPPGQTA
jgi:acyl carrier protein